MKLGLTYKVIIDSIEHTVQPLGRVAFSITREQGTRVYKTALRNALTFKGADFTLLNSHFETLGVCSAVRLVISNLTETGATDGDFSNEFSDDFFIDTGVVLGGTLYDADFYLSDCDIDYDLCTITVTPRANDVVTCFDRNKALDANFFDVDKFTMQPFFGTYEETLEVVFDANPDNYPVLPPDPENWCPDFVSSEVIPSIAPLYEHRTVWYRVKATGTTTTPPTQSGEWTQIGSSAEWFKCPNFNILVQPEGRLLRDVLINVANDLGCGLDVASHFFNINTGMLPAGVPANGAYEYAAQFLTDLVVFQKSDVKRPTATNKAGQASFTVRFETFLSDLKMMFNVQWRFVNENLLQIEHVSYFENVAAYDLTGINTRLKITHDQLENVKNETYQWSDENGHNNNFGAFPIAYLCASATQTKANRLTYFNNDILFIQDANNADKVSDAGFVLCSTEYAGGAYNLIDSNLPLSWQRLHANLHLWGKLHKFGQINNVDIEFESTEGIKKHEISHYCLKNDEYNGVTIFDPTKNIETVLGVGIIEEAEYDYINEKMKLTIRY